MTTIEATAEVFWTAFQALSKKERDAVVARFLKEKNFREDLIDVAILEERQREPSRSLDEYLSARKKKI
jgi:hypothetical protein